MSNKYICHRCGQDFPRAENLKKHLARKNPCFDRSKFDNIRSSIISDPIPTTILPFTDPVCPFCGKHFSTITNRNKHVRYTCKASVDAKINSLVHKKTKYNLEEVFRHIQESELETRDQILNYIRDFLNRL
jgi:DNA-directed RNA polymerase subunit RPC12/RpoP